MCQDHAREKEDVVLVLPETLRYPQSSEEEYLSADMCNSVWIVQVEKAYRHTLVDFLFA